MYIHLLSLLAGMSLIGIIGVAQADEPMRLSESQMDQVSAGNGVMITINGVQASIGKNGVLTVNGVPIKEDFTNLLVESDDGSRLTVARGENLRALTIDDVPIKDVTNSVLEAGGIKLSMARAENVRIENAPVKLK